MMQPILITLFPSPLAQSVARLLQVDLLIAKFERFADSEIKVTLPDPALFRGAQVHIFQSTGAPVNDTALGVAFLAQQLKQAGARKVTLVSPYFGYLRQEKSAIPGQPGHAQIIARIYESAGIDELITVELHDQAVKGFFTIPVYELKLNDVIADHIKRLHTGRTDLCIVAPDKGSYEQAAQVALLVGAAVLVFSKERYDADKTRIVGVTGAATGKVALLTDDILDTGGTAINVARALKDMNYNEVIGYFIHPVFSGDALERIDASPFSQVFVSNTLPFARESRKVQVFDISGMLAELIWRKLAK